MMMNTAKEMNAHRLTPLQALTIAGKGGQEHRDTDRGATLALPRSYPYRRIQPQENRTQENTAIPLATTDTGDRLAHVGSRPLGL